MHTNTNNKNANVSLYKIRSIWPEFFVVSLNKRSLNTYSTLTFEIEIDTLRSRIDVFANASMVVASSRIVSVAVAGSGGPVAELSRCEDVEICSFARFKNQLNFLIQGSFIIYS